MADILYTYGNQVYANITNRCNCNCVFCIRHNGSSVGDATNLWLEKDVTLDEIKAAMDAFDFTNYSELIYCGYGEPTYALENLIESARYAKEHFGLKIRVNTNGLGSLIHETNIVPKLKDVVDTVSISLNAPDRETYEQISRPVQKNVNTFEAMLQFASECNIYIPTVKFTVVDIISKEQIAACQNIADAMKIPLRVRTYIK